MNADRDVPAARRFVAVTFGELAAWHASGETRLLRSRIVDIPTSDPASGEPAKDGESARMLLRRLPPLALDDEEGVLIARLSSGMLNDATDDSQLACVPIDMLDALVPLTERAKAILADRLVAYEMALQKPWFQDVYRNVSCAQRIQASIRAASALVSVFCPEAAWEVTDDLRATAEQALVRKDFEGSAGVGSAREPVSVTWVSVAFGWTRRAPDGKGAVGDLYDAGAVLKQLGSQLDRAAFAEALERLRSCAKSIKTKLGDVHVGIREVLCCDEFAAAAGDLQRAAPEAFPAGLDTLVLYLRWQEKFHAAGSSIDIRSLSNDMRELSRVTPGDVVAAALWLLGFYAGSDRVMPLKYATQSPAPSWFRGRAVGVERFEPAAAKPAANSDTEAVAAGTTGIAMSGEATDPALECRETANVPAVAEAPLQNLVSDRATTGHPPEAIRSDGAIEAAVPLDAASEEATGGPRGTNDALLVASPSQIAADAGTQRTLEHGETGSLLPESAGAADGTSGDAGSELRGSTSPSRKRAGKASGGGGTQAKKSRQTPRRKPKTS